MMTIKEYLKDFGTKVRRSDSCSYTELMMDDHKCIEYGGVQYYIPDSFQTDAESILFDFLVDNYHV